MRREYFDDMYASSADPWGFTSRWYEQRKYALTLAALTRDRYRSAFEPGCSIGVLTAQLAMRCDRLLSVDLVESAVRSAAQRVRSLPSTAGEVEVGVWDATRDPWPDGPFDLVVVSEMLYYLDAPVAAEFVEAAIDHLAEDGEIVLVHWRPRVPEYPLTGDEAHAVALRSTGLDVAGHYADDDLVLDVLVRVGAASVAEREGLRTAAARPTERVPAASLGQWLADQDFPAGLDRVLAPLVRRRAPTDLLRRLNHLPLTTAFGSLDELTGILGDAR